MKKGRRERIEKGSRERIEIARKGKRRKGNEMTICRGGGGTVPLVSACCSASSRRCGTPQIMQ